VQLSDTGPVSSDVCQDHKGDPRLCKRGIRVILGSSIFLQGQLLRSLTVGLDTNKFISLEVESSDAIDNVKAEIQKGNAFHSYNPNAKQKKQATPLQISVLETAFKRNRWPDVQLCQRLSSEINKSPHFVKVCLRLPSPCDQLTIVSCNRCGFRIGASFIQ